jgi:hypothetical protein
VRHSVDKDELLIPLTIPGRETVARLKLAKGEATITTRETGLADALVTLHKFPGQHSADIRMNWIFLKLWGWLADATVYLLLLVTVTGIYLWYVLRAERKAGLILLIAGAVSFFGMAYVLSR